MVQYVMSCCSSELLFSKFEDLTRTRFVLMMSLYGKSWNSIGCPNFFTIFTLTYNNLCNHVMLIKMKSEWIVLFLFFKKKTFCSTEVACSDWRVIFMWRDININFGLVLCVLKSLIRWRMGRMGCALFFWLDLPGGWIFLPQKCAVWRAGARVRAEGNTPAVVSSSYAGKGRCVVGGAWRQAAATANVAKYLMRSPCSRRH